MAYINQETKAKIVEALKPIIPKGWKVSYKIQHYSTLCVTIQSAPYPIIDDTAQSWRTEYTAEAAPIIAKIRATIDSVGGNYDRSDIMTDYFDVGFYVHINVGTHAKPFQLKAA